MKCILHIGPTKTGSTTIQAFLRKNKETLLRQGVLALADRDMQRRLPYLFKRDANMTPWAAKKQLDEPQNLQRLQHDTCRYIENQVRKHTPETLVLSSEGLTRLNAADMAAMHAYLSTLAAELEIVLFLRRPDFRILSAYKNRVRHKSLRNSITAGYLSYFDDYRTIDAYSRYFGARAIIPVISSDSHPCKHEAAGHIESILKIILGQGKVSLDPYVIPENRNIAWDYRAVEYMRQFNNLVGSSPQFEKHRTRLARLLQDHFSGGEKPTLTRSIAEKIVANYESSCEAIRKQYFPDQDTLFHSDFSMYTDDKTQVFGAAEAVFVSMVLMDNLLEKQQDSS
jgi:hypothetical protein